jgi:hypothetical protein
MTGLAFLGFLIVAALLYWRCRSAAARASTQARATSPTQAAVVDIAKEGQSDVPLDPIASGLTAILREKSAALQTYERFLRQVGNDPALRRVLERTRAEDSRQVEQLHQQLQLHLQKQTEEVSKAA